MRHKLLSFGVLALLLAFALPAAAQDYRARVQGVVADSSGGALPGVNVTLKNDNTGVEVVRQTDAEGRYLFDFVEPGVVHGDRGARGLQEGRAEERPRGAARRRDREPDARDRRPVGDRSPSRPRRSRCSTTRAARRPRWTAQLVDQTPISGRNPYNLASFDPSIMVSTSTNENRPYHHAYANDYDAGGGTRRANDVLLDGVPLGASYKTSYTPAVDAVEEVTISKNSRGRRERQQPRRHHQPEHEVGHEHVQGIGLRVLPRSQHERPLRPDAGRHAREQSRCAAASCGCTAPRSAGRS